MMEYKIVDSQVFNYYPRLDKVRRYVEAHLSDHLSLEQVAGIAGLEKNYFSTYFRRKTGIRFHDWLNSVRVKKALNLLSYREISITEVAMTVGYQELRTFERAVRKHTGNTPLYFKKQFQPETSSHIDANAD